jgi:acetyl-CoA C-acetyltransferase
MVNSVHVAGAGSTCFGTHHGRTLQSLAAEAALAALADSNIPPARIGCVFVGNFVGGIMTGQELLGPIVAADLGLIGVSAIKIEAACASSSAGVRLGHKLIEAGAEDAVLVVGVERLTGFPRDLLTTAMTAAIDQGTEGQAGLTFPGFWGMVMARHMHLYGTTREQVAAVTVKNRRYGAGNPLAQFRKPVAADEVVRSPLICDPIRRYDCCPATDGAAAVVLSREDLARQYGSPSVRIAASVLVNAPVRITEYAEITTHDGTVEAANKAYQIAGVSPDDIDVAELHDCFSIAEIVDSEDLGFFAKGEGGAGVARKSRVIINPSGGLLSKGHPTGATGCGQIYEVAMQLRGRHPNQVANARLGLTHNGGGTAAAVAVHVFEAVS